MVNVGISHVDDLVGVSESQAMLLLNSSSRASNVHTAVVAANTVVYYGSMNSKIKCEISPPCGVGLDLSKLHASCMQICSITRANSIETVFFQVRNGIRWPLYFAPFGLQSASKQVTTSTILALLPFWAACEKEKTT